MLQVRAVQELVESQLQTKQNIAFHVFTTSMSPAVKPGDVLVFEGSKKSCPAPGSIVLVGNGEVWFAHRLLRRIGSPEVRILTKGDNTPCADPSWPELAILGEATALRRGERQINLNLLPRRLAGRIIAWLSHRQAAAFDRLSGFPRRFTLALLRRMIYLIAVSSY